MGEHAKISLEEMPSTIPITEGMTQREREDVEAHNLAVARIFNRKQELKEKRVISEGLFAWGIEREQA